MKPTTPFFPFLALLPSIASAHIIIHRQTPLPSLHDLFVAQGKLYLGNIADTPTLSSASNTEILAQSFGQLTAENSMKWESIHPSRDVYDFEAPDAFVDFAVANNMSIRGHTLVWHSQLAPFVEEITDPDELAEVIREHVSTVVGRYKGKIRAWDVVNEVFNEDGSMRESVFFNVLGEEFVKIAFDAAREADEDAVLYINDFNIDNAESSKLTVGMVDHVTRWLEEGVLIDGIGTQTHLLPSTAETVPGALVALAETGVSEIAITELDITDAPPADYVLVTNGCLAVPSCVGITVWGVRDSDSWRPGEDPLLFDADFQPKEAFGAMVEALGGDASETGMGAVAEGGGATTIIITGSMFSSFLWRVLRVALVVQVN